MSSMAKVMQKVMEDQGKPEQPESSEAVENLEAAEEAVAGEALSEHTVEEQVVADSDGAANEPDAATEIDDAATNAEASTESGAEVDELPTDLDAVAEAAEQDLAQMSGVTEADLESEQSAAEVSAAEATESGEDVATEEPALDDEAEPTADATEAEAEEAGELSDDTELGEGALGAEGVSTDEADPSGFIADDPLAASVEAAETALNEEPADELPVDVGPAAPEGAAIPATAPAAPVQPLPQPTGEWDPKRVDPVVIAFHDRYSAVCEQYRSIRARLLTMNVSREPQVLAITSSIPEEGKSVSTLNLSLIMAEGGEHRILAADLDFRRSSLARMLGITPSPGLANVLRGEMKLEDVFQPTPFPNLKILPAGDVRDNSYGELLGKPAMATVLEQLRTDFDYAFLDTPPITTVSDVCLVSPYCDGAIVVIEMRRTPEPTVQQAVRTLQANNVKILGCILSRYREGGSRYYDHYYSYYYR